MHDFLTRIDTESRPIVITIFFPERLYTQFLFTYLEHGQKEGRRRVPRFPRRKIETREHLRLIAPLPDQSSRCGSNPHDFPLYISIIFRTIDQSMYRFPSFLFRSRWKRGSSPLCILTSLRSVLPTVR